MAKIRINGDTSGYIEISAPAVAGSTSITLPATTGGSLLATDANGNLNVDSGVLYVDGVNNLVGVGTTSPGNTFAVNGAGISLNATNGNSLLIYRSGTGTDEASINLFDASSNRVKISNSGGNLWFGTAGATERARFDTSGRFLLGTSTARSTGSGSGMDLQIEGAPSPSNIGAVRNSNNAFPARVALAKTRGTSVGSNTIVQSGDSLGLLEFDGADGTKLVQGAGIEAFVDGTPGTNDMPTRLVFSTTADGASSPTERMRIDSSGRVGIGTTTVDFSQFGSNTGGVAIADIGSVNTGLKISDGSYHNYLVQAGNGNFYISHYGAGDTVFSNGTSGEEACRIDASRRLLVGTSSSTGANVKGVFGAGLASSDGVLVVNTNDQAINAITISNWDGATTTNGAKMTFSNSGIGDFIIGAGSGINRFEVFNGAGTGVFLTSGNTSWTSTSDERLKTDLAPIENAIDRVNSLRAVTGRFKTDEEGVSRGFLIAQDVQLVFPEAVDNSNPDELGVRYTEVIPLLVAALKESKERIEALEAKVAALETA